MTKAGILDHAVIFFISHSRENDLASLGNYAINGFHNDIQALFGRTACPQNQKPVFFLLKANPEPPAPPVYFAVSAH